MTEKQKEKVETLIAKAAEAQNPDEAMKLAQAALNAANALCAMRAAT